MKRLYIDCSMGAAGDMLAAALLELFPNREEIINELNSLGLEEVIYQQEKSVKCGITGTHFKVLVHGEEEGEHHHEDHHHEGHHHEGHLHEGHHYEGHHHEGHHHEGHHETGHHHGRGMHEIGHIVNDHLKLKESVKKAVMSVYGLIAEAESKVHGVPVSQIHFHEVGNMDAIGDIVAVCTMLDKIGADEIMASPIHVGSGQVKCAHGILPVPAPATAEILKGIPCYGGEIRGELCTPTGAALLKYFVKEFGKMPIMAIDNIGYGMGKKDFSQANCVRIFLGRTEDKQDSICEFSCNVDDMTGEAMGFAMEKLLEAGAVDVYFTPIYMKKSRPGILLRVMCHEEKKEAVMKAIFRNTSTIGVRENILTRYILERKSEEVETSYGKLSCKTSSGYGVNRKKYEYEDLVKAAKEHNLSLEELLLRLNS